MPNNLSRIIASAAVAFSSKALMAQRGQLEYAVGGRLGNGIGLSLEYFKTNRHVFEGIAFTQWKGYNLTGLYHQHYQIADIKGLKYYAGFGAHVNVFPDTRTIPDQYATKGRSLVVPGFDGVVGLEYFFRYIPVQVSVDWKPEYNFVYTRRWYYYSSAISIRYRL